MAPPDFRDFPYHRTQLDEMWARCKSFLDEEANFASDFANPEQRSSRLWELVLCDTLHSAGILAPRTWGSTGPDFRVQRGGDFAWVEAVAPTPGGAADRVPSVPENRHFSGTDERRFMLRYAQSFREKHDYLGRWSGVVNDTDPYVIAISGCAIRRADYEDRIPGEPPMIVRMLYGVGELSVAVPVALDQSAPREEPTAFYPKQLTISRHSGSLVDVGQFCNSEFERVSAVMFSLSVYWPDSGPVPTRLFVIHNPLARNPMPRGLLPGREVYVESNGRIQPTGW